jgi:hypothetical protein
LDIQARLAISKELTKYSFLVAKFDASLIANEPEYTEDELKQYFEEHQDAYKIGEQVVLDYVEFPRELFMGKIEEASKFELHRFYKTHKNQFKNLKEGSDELERALIKAYENDQTARLTIEAADQFTSSLYEKNIAYDSDEFKQLIADGALKVSNLDPVTLGQFSENEYFSSEPLFQGSK